MKETKPIRCKWLTIRLSEEEEKKLQQFSKRTTANSISEYARLVLLNQPVRVLYRNQSADDFLTEMLGLKKEMNAISNNFNQAVHKLYTLEHFPDIKSWVLLNENFQQVFLKKMKDIQEKMNQIYIQWSQE